MATILTEGTSAMTSGLTVFNKAASVAYQNISPAEKQKLNSSERLDCMGQKAIKKEGKRIFFADTECGNICNNRCCFIVYLFKVKFEL